MVLSAIFKYIDYIVEQRIVEQSCVDLDVFLSLKPSINQGVSVSSL